MLYFSDSKNTFAGVFRTHRKRTNRNTPTQVTSNKLTHTWTKTNTYAIKHSTTYTQNTKKEMPYTYIYTCKCKYVFQLYMWMPGSVYSRTLPSIEIEIRSFEFTCVRYELICVRYWLFCVTHSYVTCRLIHDSFTCKRVIHVWMSLVMHTIILHVLVSLFRCILWMQHAPWYCEWVMYLTLRSSAL